jgi:NAD(P)-dependent dehydrogenase (short-subunit alcohol dehydrogenase family)
MHIQGKAALVTGAGRGLGAALARDLGRRGAKVALVARREEEIERVASDIRRAGGEAHALRADISQKDAIYPLAGAAAALIGPIDILIHNASALGRTPLQLLLDTDCEDFSDVLETNVVGPFRLSKIIAGSMALRESGTIVHVSSDAAASAYARWGAYSASKAASDHLARIWAAELSDFGVRVFSVDPGEMDTEMHARALPDADRSALADPLAVSRTIVAMIEADTIPSGARLEAGGWKGTA